MQSKSGISPLVRPYRRFRKWWQGIAETIDHQAVLTQVDEDGAPSYSYAFMVTISAGIAIIGLLLNSPAVIIGAMLVSPLMGPIVLSGISLSTLNHSAARKSAKSLSLGIMLALAISVIIVFASPITDATPEILARTRPNLFDLLVAMLSGLAGGYAVIRGRGSAIVGVAIATALMPPLTVIGYGIATWQWAIARGATLLFITNMLAIGLSVAFVATWYGFGRRGLRRELAWQSMLALFILIPLAIPLVLSLKSIAHETYTSRIARQVLEDVLKSGKTDTRIVQFQPVFAKDAIPVIDAVVLTQSMQKELTEKASNRLTTILGKKIRYHIDQIVVSDVRKPESPPSAIANPIQKKPTTPPPPSLAETFRKSFPLETESIVADETTKRMRIIPKPGNGADILSLYRMEKTLMAHLPGWAVTLVPPAQPLPKLYFDRNKAVLTAVEMEKLQAIIWSLHAWNARKLDVTGHASTRGHGNLEHARQRAREIAQLLRQEGFDVTENAAYPVAGQRSLERQFGYDVFRSVDIVLASKWEEPTGK